jgi:sugar lactone lactonase YvrE
MTKLSMGRVLAASLLGVALAVPLATPAQAAPRGPDRIELPNGFLPEGITIGPGKVAYFGSRADGDIYRADLRTGKGRVISQGPGTQAVGLKSDQRGRLFVAGGMSGTGRVVSTRTGETVRTYRFTTNPSFVNDVVLTRRTAWFTDSRQAQLYAVRLSRHGVPARENRFRTLPLSGDWVQTPEVNNANGISTTPDGRALLVVQSNTGNLYRVHPRTGRATRVDLGGTALTNGDGLLRQGRILYVVQNRLNQVAVLKLNRSGTAGRLVSTLTNPDFDVPTTVAAYGKSLYLPNARFTTEPTPDTPYWVTRIPRY